MHTCCGILLLSVSSLSHSPSTSSAGQGGNGTESRTLRLFHSNQTYIHLHFRPTTYVHIKLHIGRPQSAYHIRISRRSRLNFSQTESQPSRAAPSAATIERLPSAQFSSLLYVYIEVYQQQAAGDRERESREVVEDDRDAFISNFDKLIFEFLMTKLRRD